MTTVPRRHVVKRQTSGFGVFVGIHAETTRPPARPAGAERITDRLWLDASDVADGLRGGPLPLNPDETAWLAAGVRRVAPDIEAAEPSGLLVIAVRAIERVEVDYLEAALAPAIAGWAAEEFAFPPHPVAFHRDDRTGGLVVTWPSTSR